MSRAPLQQPPPLGRPASAPSAAPVSSSWGPSPTCSPAAAVSTPRAATLNVVSFNCNGLRSASMKGNHPLHELFAAYEADVFCFQETKMSGWPDVEAMHGAVPGYDAFFSFSRARKGWSGVATFVREGCTLSAQEDLGDPRTDGEGRIMRTDHGHFVLFNIYFPNAGRGPERLVYKLAFYTCIEEHVRALIAQGRHVIVVGDVNTAHKPIDMWTDQYSDHSGCLPVERAWMDGIIRSDLSFAKDRANAAPAAASNWMQQAAAASAVSASASPVTSTPVDPTSDSDELASPATFTTASSMLAAASSSPADPPPPLVDSYRYFNPERRAYSWWDMRKGHRETNDGWRIDYMLVDSALLPQLADAEIHSRQRGSDHCPTSLHLQLPPASSPALASATVVASSSPSSSGDASSRLARLGRFLSHDSTLSFPFPALSCPVASRARSKFQRQGSLQSFFAKSPTPSPAAAAASTGAWASPTISSTTQTKRKADEIQPPPRPANALAALRAPPASISPSAKKSKNAPSAASSNAAASRGPSIADLFQRKPQ